MGVIGALTAAWFLPVRFSTLMGDDLYLDYGAHHGGYASSLTSALTQGHADKYRPLLTVFLVAFTHLFNGDYLGYRNVDLILQLLNTWLLGYLVWRVTDRRWTIAVGAMAAVTVSRFNAFDVLQVYGFMEGLALTFMILMLICVEAAYRRSDASRLVLATVCFTAAEFTHERFILLLPFMLVAILLAPIDLRSSRLRLAWCTLPVAAALLNYGVKTWAVHTAFFTGGGGQPLQPSPSQVLTLLGDGIVTIGGYNVGPAYLSGQPGSEAGGAAILLALAFAAPLGIVATAVVVQATRLAPLPALVWFRRGALGAALFGPLLLSASITFRQEYRWLYAPFVVLIVGAAWALGQLSRSRVLPLCLVVAVFGGSIAVDAFYRRSLSSVYFMAAQSRAEAVHADLIEGHRAQLSDVTVFFVSMDPTFQQFDLADGEMFAVYAPDANVDVRFLTDAPSVCRTAGVRPERLIYRVTGSDIIDVTQVTGRCVGPP